MSQNATTTIQSCLVIILIPVLLAGCGPAFQAQNVDMESLSPQVFKEGPTQNLKTANGELQWKSLTSATRKKLSYQLQIPYGRIYGVLSPAVRLSVPWVCSLIPEIQSHHPFAYTKAEIPCGRIISNDWKEVYRFETPAISEKSSQFEYSVSSTIAPILLHRGAYSGKYSESSLDVKGNVERTSSLTFGEDISLKYNPENSGAKLGVCVNIPGQLISSTPVTVTAKGKANILGLKPSYGSDFTVTPGFAKFDYGRTCVDLSLQIDGLIPTLNANVTVPPYLSNAQYSGLKIKINDWFLQFVDNIMSVFRASFRVALQKSATNDVNKYLDSDIETGLWFTKMHGPALVEKTAQNVNQKIQSTLKNIGIGLNQKQLEERVKRLCEIRELSGGELWTQRIQTLCRDVIQNVTFVIQPFQMDQSMKDKGCYDYYTRIHDSKSATGEKKWWASECKFTSAFSVEFPSDFSGYEEEFSLLLTDLIQDSKIPQPWKEQLLRYGIDDATAMDIWTMILSEGKKLVSASDVESAIIQYLRLN